MNLNLLSCVACSAALLLGACSSNNPPTTSSGNNNSGSNNMGSGDMGSGGDTGGERTPLQMAETALTDARRAVMAATTAAGNATPDNRAEADRLITAARRALQTAVDRATAARDATAEGTVARSTARGLLARATAYQTRQNMALDGLGTSFAWFGREVKRSAAPIGNVVIPTQGANKVIIDRTGRTEKDGDNHVANEDAIKSDTFKTVMHSAGKVLLSGGGKRSPGGVTGDLFKVDGYVVGMRPTHPLDTDIHTGLMLTSTGLSIRVGGTRSGASDAQMTDYTDMRKDITENVDQNTPPRGRNGWDLAIAFDEPVQGPDASGGRTSWQGNGDFYWRGIVEADPSQLSTTGDNYQSDAFNQPDGSQRGDVDQRDLGTYEVWLSNHFELDTKAEPSGPGRNPDDDFDGYLNYAAYGLFVYTASTATFREGTNGHNSRVQSMNFGYQAFADEDGKRTKDIGTAITSGTFVGETLATVIEGSQAGGNQRTTLLRGEVELAVTIPKDSDTAGRMRGRLYSFEEWFGTYWREYKPDADGPFSVRLGGGTAATDFVNIDSDGSYNGNAKAANTDIALGRNGVGTFKGNFYGPRATPDDLETAGSWNVGPGSDGQAEPLAQSIIIGSFGAKQYDRTSQ